VEVQILGIESAPLSNRVDVRESAGMDQQSTLYRRVRRKLLGAERMELIRLRNQGVIGEEVLRTVQHDLDLEESLLVE
jgi:hypothetical protein